MPGPSNYRPRHNRRRRDPMGLRVAPYVSAVSVSTDEGDPSELQIGFNAPVNAGALADGHITVNNIAVVGPFEQTTTRLITCTAGALITIPEQCIVRIVNPTAFGPNTIAAVASIFPEIS